MILSALSLILLLASFCITVAFLSVIVRDVSDVLTASLVSRRRFHEWHRNLAVVVLWILVLLIAGLPF